MGYSFYHVIHLICVFTLSGSVIWAISNPVQQERKKVLMISGIAGLLVFVAGIGLLHKAGLGFPLWAIVKLFVWLGLSALVGIAYKRPEKRKGLLCIAIGLITLALVMVSLKPF